MITMNASNGYSAGLDLRTSISQGGVTLTSGTDTTGFAFMRVLGMLKLPLWMERKIPRWEP